MSSRLHCSKCGAPVREEVAGGFCTACLLEEGLSSAERKESPITLKYFGDYELLEEIARGGMGVVFKARQRSLNRTVAVKMILSGHLASEAESQRFRAEARAAAALQHPGIVAIHEVGENDGLLFFSMDYVEGQNLAQIVREGPWPAIRAAQCVREVAEAIHYAHERGVLHRDLKPSNVLIDAMGKPHVTDFGLAKYLPNSGLEIQNSELTVSGQVLGSPNFMPPEQAAGNHRELTPAADVYSLGALLYHLVTGRPPFVADNVPATLRLVAETEPVSPRLLVPQLPRDLETICLRCLEKDPRRRYATAQALEDELARFLRHEPIQARPLGQWEKFDRWTGRHPVVATLSGVIALLLIAVALISMVSAVRLRRANSAGQEKLREAYLSQARANRWSGRPGRRFESLEAIKKAVAIRPGPDLRDEAIAAMALVDLRPARTWDVSGGRQFHFDSNCEHYVRSETNGAIVVRRVRDDFQVIRLPGLEIPLFECTLSPDGGQLAAHYRSRGSLFDFKVYDLRDGGKVRLAVPDRWVRAMPFSPDGRMLAMSWAEWEGKKSRSRVTFYDLDTARELNSFPTDNLPYGVSFSPDGKRVAIGSAESFEVKIYSVPEGEKLQTLVHSNGTYGISWDAKGRRLATASSDGNIYLWDLSGDPPALALVPHRSFAMSAVFHPRDDLLLTFGWDHVARLWNPDTARELLSAPADWIGTFSADGRWIRIHPVPNSVGLFEFAVADHCRPYYFDRAPSGSRRALHSPDGRWLVSAHEDGLRLMDIATGNSAVIPEARDTRWLQFTHDGQSLITAGDHGVHWWPVRSRVDSGKTLIEVGPASPLNRETAGTVHATNRMMAVANGKAYLFDSTSFRIERRLTTPQGITEGVLSPDGHHAATWSRETGAVNVWDAADGRRLATLGPPPSPRVSFSPDGRWLVTATAEDYRFWETGSWTLRKTLRRGVTGGTHGEVAFTPDSTMVALAVGRGEVALYDAITFASLATLEPPEVVPVSDLEFSPDGAHLVVSIAAPVVYRWDLRLVRRELAEMKLDFARPPLPASSSRAAPPLEFHVVGPAGRDRPRLSSLNFSPRNPACTTRQIDLSGFYNVTLTNSWFNPAWKQNDLSELPQGLQIFDGVAFDVRGIVQLASSHPDLAFPYPKEISGIKVQQTSRALHFLHASGWGAGVGADIGEYVIQYADGAERSVPLTYAENIWNWWDTPGRTAPMSRGTTLAWRGRNPWSDAAGIDLLLFHFRWENPRPAVPIAAIGFRSRMTKSAPFLIALTME